MKKKTVSDYEFYWDDLDLCVSPFLDDIDPALALPLSVEKWDVARKADSPASVRTNGPRTCGLCAVHWGWSDCGECIVRQATGEKFCYDTPHARLATGSNLTDEQAAALFEDEYQFLLALQEGGVKAGREWLMRWNASQVHDVITEALVS